MTVGFWYVPTDSSLVGCRPLNKQSVPPRVEDCATREIVSAMVVE